MMSKRSHSRILVVVVLLLVTSCQNRTDARLSRLEARVAKLERPQLITEADGSPRRGSEASDVNVPRPAGINDSPSALLSSAPPTQAEAAPIIEQHCAAKWPTDFEMLAYCKKQQREAVGKLIASPPPDVAAEVFATIRSHCAQKWPTDFEMREYCEGQQVTGYRESK